MFGLPPFDHCRNEYPRNSSTLVVLNHHCATLVRRLGEERGPAEPPAGQWDMTCLVIQVRDKDCLIWFGKADRYMVHRSSARSHIPFRPGCVTGQVHRRVFETINIA